MNPGDSHLAHGIGYIRRFAIREQLYKAIDAKSYGIIEFPDNRYKKAQFIRVAPDTSIDHIKHLLFNVWSDTQPSLVISITGGAKKYKMPPRMVKAFRQGLLKVASSTGAWIITGGLNTGIMKLIGEIVRVKPVSKLKSRPINLIGIATWGCVAGATDRLVVQGEVVRYPKQREEVQGEASLEPNHTNFLLIDDGLIHKYGGEIQFRARLEKAISATGNRQLHQLPSFSERTEPLVLLEAKSTPVPVVLLVIEGGPNTIRTVHEAVVQNSIPAVLFDGTGRCCNFFGKVYRKYLEYKDQLIPPKNATQSENITTTKPITEEEVKQILRAEVAEDIKKFRGKDNLDQTDYFQMVYECIHKKFKLLTIIGFNLDDLTEPDIDLVILKALLIASNIEYHAESEDGTKSACYFRRKLEQLQLALDWDRVDIAKTYIMTDKEDWAEIDLNKLFITALERNQVNFIKLFLEHDFSLTSLFENYDKLSVLYRMLDSSPHTSSYYRSLDIHLDDNTDGNIGANDTLYYIYRRYIKPLIGDFFEIDAVLGTTTFEDNTSSNNPSRQNSEAFIEDMDIDKLLLFWAVLTNKQDCALLFWSRTKNKICAALTANLLYTKIIANKRFQYDKGLCQERAHEFEQLAINLLNLLYKYHKRECTYSIVRQIPSYGNCTWLSIAAEANAKNFIAHRAVQDVLKNIWYGYIHEETSDTMIVLSSFIPLLSGFINYQTSLIYVDADQAVSDEVKY
ncbi:unnamed protein product [Didymodactylos carnosus]|uniref:TRPM SLOG domain-containing protein n=1 Tax=Didymodactylos carnosus TaxID=1234261 RepID=A0A815KFB5_9BILA|nr:unnamed protein product [Didymodactylos carnosus]CAF1392426.1 unnamed protein product [Didymodactylos carnosus]CAF3988454.1 unnamed protein product [Didymodactylos carnosus]CAF4286878.1 unnamed protein product [Didymodactylos carnosus]